MKEKPNVNQQIRNFPQDIRNLPRRLFIQKLIGSATAASFLPSLFIDDMQSLLSTNGKSPTQLIRNKNRDEKFWSLVKEHFSIRKDLIMMNSANMSPSPLVVQQYVFKYMKLGMES